MAVFWLSFVSSFDIVLQFGFRLSQPHQKQKERDQREREKERPAVVVNPRVYPAVVELNAKFTDDEDTKAVSDDGQRNDEQRQEGAPPGRAQEEVPRQETGNEQDLGGVDPAALRRHPQTEISRQIQDQPLLVAVRPGQAEKAVGGSGRSMLEEVFKPRIHTLRIRNHEKQQRQRKGERRHRGGAQRGKTRRQQQQQKRQHHHAQIIRLSRKPSLLAGMEIKREDGASRRRRRRRRSPGRPDIRAQPGAPEPDEIPCYQGHERHVGVKLAVHGEPHPIAQRNDEAKRHNSRQRRRAPPAFATQAAPLKRYRRNSAWHGCL